MARKKETKEEVITLADGKVIHRFDGPGGKALIWEHEPEPSFDGEVWCPDCHEQCTRREEGSYWECDICKYSITDEDIEDGEGYFTLESTFESEDQYDDLLEDLDDEDDEEEEEEEDEE